MGNGDIHFQFLVSATRENLNEGISFSAFMTDGYTYPDVLETIPFNGVLLNSGGFYNPDDSVFTCPVNGVYYFAFNLYTPEIGSQSHISNGALLVDGKLAIEAYCSDADIGEFALQCGNSAVLSCDAGFEVRVVPLWPDSQVYGTLDNQRCTSFQGFFLHSVL